MSNKIRPCKNTQKENKHNTQNEIFIIFASQHNVQFHFPITQAGFLSTYFMKKLIFSFLLCCTVCQISAQTNEDYNRFTESAEGYSNLFRGTAPLAYKFTHTGTYFAYSSDFSKGKVVYNNKTYHDVLLNLNSHLDELYLFINYSGRYVVLNKEFVDSFTMGDREFVNVRTNSLQDNSVMAPGFYEVLYKNKSVTLFKKIKKSYSERINQAASSETGSKLERLFLLSNSYFLTKGKSTYAVKRVGDIIRLYPEKRRDIRVLIRERDLDVRHDRDRSYTEIIKLVESTNTVSR